MPEDTQWKKILALYLPYIEDFSPYSMIGELILKILFETCGHTHKYTF
jgi:hypothetical protein